MGARDLSARTVRHTHAVLSSALKQAVRWGLLTHNVATMVDLPRQEQHEMKALSPEEAGRFLAAAKADRHAALSVLALDSGMRPEEYLALKWDDVDLRARTVNVRRALVRARGDGGGWQFEEPKTPQSRRTIPIGATTVKVLRLHVSGHGDPKRAGRRAKYGAPDEEVAKALGVAEKTLRRAEAHVAAVEAGVPAELPQATALKVAAPQMSGGERKRPPAHDRRPLRVFCRPTPPPPWRPPPRGRVSRPRGACGGSPIRRPAPGR